MGRLGQADLYDVKINNSGGAPGQAKSLQCQNNVGSMQKLKSRNGLFGRLVGQFGPGQARQDGERAGDGEAESEQDAAVEDDLAVPPQPDHMDGNDNADQGENGKDVCGE
ncbi:MULTISPECIES: hypothetical protein [Bradyrhizobium]|uniref:hypothetical protein n=1 Tax=Bradyrhizobium TaxID=374 RepID=UPI0013E8AF39